MRFQAEGEGQGSSSLGGLGYLCKVGRGHWQRWARVDGSGGWLRLACHFQLVQSPWTHGPVWIKAADRLGPLRGFPLCFELLFCGLGSRAGPQPFSPLSHPSPSYVSLSCTLACPSSQRVRQSFCPRALALACPQAACHTSPWFLHSPQFHVTSGEGEEGLSLPHHSFLRQC